MAIARGAGTEIIRSAHFEGIDGSAAHKLIFGVQHHIYTVLSVIIYCDSVQAASNIIDIKLRGYDAKAGTSAQDILLSRANLSAAETFVWNDKFSFNGYEPVDFTGPLDSEAKQDAIADQLVSGDSNRQILYIQAENASDNFDVHITFIDQNNA